MNRWIGAWIVAVGICLIGTSASAHAAAVSAPATTRPTPFNATLRNGVTVELLGISVSPSNPKAWWAADGSWLAKAPYLNLKANFKNMDAANRASVRGLINGIRSKASREIALNLLNLSGPTQPAFWVQRPHANMYSAIYERNGSQDEWTHAALVATIDPKQHTTTVHATVASGPFKDSALVVPGKPTEVKIDGVAVLLKEMKDVNGSARLTVVYPYNAFNIHIIPVDHAGKRHDSSGSSYYKSGPYGDLNAKPKLHYQTMGFDLKLADIKAFIVQTRQYEWVQFEGVALQPGVKTKVHITTGVQKIGGETDLPDITN